MKRLLIDIETAPNMAYVWGLFNQNIAPSQVQATGHTLCWAAKWYGQKPIMFDSIYHSSEEHMLQRVWALLNQADAVIHYNGTRFDNPTLQKEFLINDMPPPAPYKQVDLIKTVRGQFRFHSNKLDEVLKALGMETKIQHKGMELWTECMRNEAKAWAAMKRYNKRDVKIMEGFYERLLPWIKNHPNMGLYLDTDRPTCPKCGGTKMVKQGTRKTQAHIYQRFQCQDCNGWAQSRFNSTPPGKKETVLKACHD